MPKLKIDHVVSFSNEDPVHVANNLLDPDPTKKWKCQNAGEKSAIVVLQLEKATVISGIDVGNENSAYVEVLVTRSGNQDDYKVLLVMSSFMSPLEARQGTNPNKVRMFTAKDLSQPECDQKWDRIKIVCTQPFNRHVQYGLSFVTFYTPEDKQAVSEPLATIGKFTLRPSSPDVFSAGNLFARRKEQDTDNPPSVAAAIRQAQNATVASQNTSPSITSSLIKNKQSNTQGTSGDLHEPKPRNKNSLLYDEDDEAANKKIDELINKKNKEREEKRLKDKENSEEKKTRKTKDDQATNTPKKNAKQARSKESLDSPGPSKRKNTNLDREKGMKKLKTSTNRKPFNKLLEDVTLVISGIQNPDRSTLRSMAATMGARYKADWDSSCTHLVCAFPNTPKFNQVKGKGKIVTRKWVEDCHNQRKRLPWRRYCLDKNDKNKNESEDEIEELIEEIENKSDSETAIDNCERDHMEEASDTEDIVESLLKKEEKTETSSTPNKDVNSPDDPYSVDTDTEEFKVNVEETEPEFKDLFGNKTFFIDTGFSKHLYKQLNKYIVAYNGITTDDPTNEDIDFFITETDRSENIRDINPNALCVKSKWVSECHNKQTTLPVEDYVC